MYSLNDMDRLLEIKDYISEGHNIAAIKKKYAEREAKSKKAVSQTEVRRAPTMNSSSRGALLQYGHPLVAVRQSQVVIY